MRAREISLLIRTADDGARVVRVGDCAGGHVVAADFGAVKVKHRAVIPQEVGGESCKRRGIRDGERRAEIGGDVFVVQIRPVTDHGHLTVATETESCRTGTPRTVAKTGFPPRRPEVGALVEILPNRTARNENTLSEGGSDAGKQEDRELKDQ